MCGICGFTGQIVDRDDTIKRMTEVITHRGPDSDGLFQDDYISMGFRRLSIIDLEGGTQPIYNEDKSLVITFNGEIYNYQILREELKKAGHKFYTDTDSEVLLTDRYDNLIYTTLDPREDPQDKQPSNKFSLPLENDGILSLDGSRYYAVRGTVGPQALRLCTLTSLDMQLRMLLYSAGLFIVLLLLLSGVVVAMTRAFTRRNAMELGELTAAVENLSKNGGAEALPPQCSEESQALYTRFRELIAHNDELLDRRRQMEIKNLEEQFNPHFVYNVMETVRYQISEDPETASEMLVSFASLMRYSVNYGHTKVSLETDVEYVNDYLLLQKARYNNCLLYEFDIPEELLECRVPKLLLQPVIENSIVHGYRAGRTLSIRVQAEHRDGMLRFTVTDDGAGIPAGRLAELRESFERDLTNEYAAHVGLYNIQKVIQLIYGAPYGVQIESTEGQGTAVTLTIPYEVEENEGC